LKLLIVRHGDPDYGNDSLTEKGWKEAEYLSERLIKVDAKAYYVSPLGRAKDTASYTLKRLGRTAVECPWLREFCAPIQRPDAPGRRSIAWDWLPEDWLREERFLLPDRWQEPDAFQEGGVKREYDWVTENLDALLERHGYRREGLWYRAVRPNNDVLVFFCHFGVECVLLSHLLHISPMILWHGFCAAPSSVTTVVTEERREGTAVFRMSAFGDTSHLFQHGEPPAFAARFCECFGNEGERRD
jgi:broad specificity phosphatase PhoE